MPKTQVANVPTLDFGPAVSNVSLKWRVKKGVKLQGRIEALEDDVTVSLQTSADNVTYASVTAADHGQVFNAVVVKAGGYVDFSINLRAGKDNYFRVNANGRGNIQLRGEEKLDLMVG